MRMSTAWTGSPLLSKLVWMNWADRTAASRYRLAPVISARYPEILKERFKKISSRERMFHRHKKCSERNSCVKFLTSMSRYDEIKTDPVPRAKTAVESSSGSYARLISHNRAESQMLTNPEYSSCHGIYCESATSVSPAYQVLVENH